MTTAYHVWHWNGEAFDLVWHDLTRAEATSLTGWRNQRAIAARQPHRYVVTPDGCGPELPEDGAAIGG